jgi:hypothetical protein
MARTHHSILTIGRLSSHSVLSFQTIFGTFRLAMPEWRRCDYIQHDSTDKLNTVEYHRNILH